MTFIWGIDNGCVENTIRMLLEGETVEIIDSEDGFLKWGKDEGGLYMT